MPPIEKKSVYVGLASKKYSVIQRYETFGWKYVGDSSWGRSGSLHADFERDFEIKNRNRLLDLERRYEQCSGKIKVYTPITETPENFLLIFALIFPFFIWLAYKHNQKKTIIANNQKVFKEREDILNEAKTLL